MTYLNQVYMYILKLRLRRIIEQTFRYTLKLSLHDLLKLSLSMHT